MREAGKLIRYRCIIMECRLRVFKNRVLKRMFGPKRNEVTDVWRILHNEELHYLYSLMCG
jgi:hypothetical protein